jgi:hypothetical protein
MADQDTSTRQQNFDALIGLALRYKKLPSESWNTFDYSVDSGTPKAIFQISHQSWLVYAAAWAQVRSAKKFDGKDHCRQFLESLDSSNLVAVVKQLDERIESRGEDQQSHIQKLLTEAESLRKRRRKLSTCSLLIS